MPRIRSKLQTWPESVTKNEPKNCGLCGRPFGKHVEKHHLVPKSQGGTQTIPLHPICHRKIHALFNEKELARRLNSVEALLANEDIQRFVKWVARKHPDFYRRTSRKQVR
ncbi:MAG: HNH endonuclease [Kordiimonadaceae bacterium]|nr:HNH endonuclease [Kordiimonadaceae bacterium]MBO6569705.1 HNH endonuclease [Kordiimonadaceae bacterium]MBO6966240.1 HNH endonuclease [Kordiimonadaceae bacterium]